MFQIIDQTDDVVIINKAPGFSVHKDDQEAGLTMALQAHLALPELFLVHRLDKVTSGVMVFAKKAAVAAELGAQFSQKKVQKFYLALSDKKPNRKQGAIVGDMVRTRRSAWKLTKEKHNPAITQFFSLSIKPGLRAFLLRPATGKTHQLRVALKSLGAPILGDELYAGSEADRTYLHAYSLSFELGGKVYCYRCLPDTGQWFDTDCCKALNEAYAEPELLNWPTL